MRDPEKMKRDLRVRFDEAAEAAEAAGKAVSFVCPRCGRTINTKPWEARVVVSDRDGLLQYGHTRCYAEEDEG